MSSINWIDVGDIEPPQNKRPLICYCPNWCDIGYQIAYWNGDEFHYEDQPNDNFNMHVEAWAIFLEAD